MENQNPDDQNPNPMDMHTAQSQQSQEGYTQNQGPHFQEQGRQPMPESKKMAAGLTAILVGSFGVHKFILGYTMEGVIILLVMWVVIPIISFATCGFGAILYVAAVIPTIEGILYLTKTDEEFIRTYQLNKKPWF